MFQMLTHQVGMLSQIDSATLFGAMVSGTHALINQSINQFTSLTLMHAGATWHMAHGTWHMA